MAHKKKDDLPPAYQRSRTFADQTRRLDNEIARQNNPTRSRPAPRRVPGQALDPVTAAPLKRGRPVPNYGSVEAGAGQDSRVPAARRQENGQVLRAVMGKPLVDMVPDALAYYRRRRRK